ncbi:TPA: hypothetical protein VAK94_004503 [Citrobacter freundii]|nr:hypothetical protein [Salmonella enterica]HEO1692174.1 hypothetical protein [Citrobacter freundii]
MSFSNNKAYAAINVSLSVIFTALLIGIASRSTDEAALTGRLFGLIICDFFFTSVATHMILSILTQNKQNQ